MCANCGRFIDPKEPGNPCPVCGSLNRKILVEDSVHVLEMLKSKGKSEDGFVFFVRKLGEKLSKYGRLAHEFFEIDRRDPETTTKTHVVEEQADDGSWKLEHDEHIKNPAKRRPKHKAEGS